MGVYESVDHGKRSTSYYDPPKMMVPPIPMQRTSMLATTSALPESPSSRTPNVADMVTKFNQNPHLKLIKSASVISRTSISSHTSTEGCTGEEGGPSIASNTQITAANSETYSMLPPSCSSNSTSSKDSSHYSHTLPHKTKSQNSGLAKLEKIYQTIYSGTLRRNKSQRKEKPDNLQTAKGAESADNQNLSTAVVKKRDKTALKYRHSCSNQDEAIYVAAKKFGAKKRKERNRRQYHSMNETIEVLADQVVEDDPLVSVYLLPIAYDQVEYLFLKRFSFDNNCNFVI